MTPPPVRTQAETPVSGEQPLSTESQHRISSPGTSGHASSSPSPHPSAPLQIQVHVTGGGSALGYNDSYLFPGAFGAFGDFIHTQVGVSALWRLAGGTVQLRAGGRFVMDHFRGDENTFGGNITAFTLGPVAELDMRGFWRNSPVAPLSRVRVDVGIGGGFGTIPAETISLHDQHGLTLSAGVGIDAVSYRIGNIDLSLGAYFSTLAVDGSIFNSTFNSVDFMVAARGPIEQEPPRVQRQPQVIERCDPVIEDIQENIRALRGQEAAEDQVAVEGLRDQAARLGTEVTDLRHHIETRELDPLQPADIRDLLRQQRIEQLRAQGLPEEAARTQAVQQYPDDYNHWESPAAMPEATSIPENLEGLSCDELADLRRSLSQEQEQLERRVADLERLKRTPLPPRIREIITQTVSTVVPDLGQLNFEHNHPTAAEVTRLRRLMTQASHNPDGTVVLTGPQMTRLLRSIFGPRHITSVLDAMGRVAARLNGQGIDNQTLSQLMSQIHVTIEGHTSMRGTPEQNQSLSQRRAEVVMELLVARGVARERLQAVGRGESQPVRPEEETLPRRSTERAEAEAANRRILLIPNEASLRQIEAALAQPEVSRTVVVGPGAVVAPSPPAPTTPAATPAQPAAQPPEATEAPQRPRRPPRPRNPRPRDHQPTETVPPRVPPTDTQTDEEVPEE